jgi:poly-gamma-glutamate capsule biosynthesis protein CapA/YwtB (metallophosphatase superfamily)
MSISKIKSLYCKLDRDIADELKKIPDKELRQYIKKEYVDASLAYEFLKLYTAGRFNTEALNKRKYSSVRRSGQLELLIPYT